MKNYKIGIGVFCFFLGVFVFSFWKKQNYVSIPIPKDTSVRNLASVSTGQQIVIDDFTTKILNIKTKQDIENVRAHILEVSKEYPDFVGVQVFAKTFEILPQFKGIIWRLRGIVELTDITHSAVLSNLRFIYNSRYAYGRHVLAFFNYFVDPTEKMNQFKSIEEVQDYLSNNVNPMLLGYLSSLELSMKLPNELHHFSFDRRIFSGEDDDKRYFDPEETKKEYIKPYTSYLISGLARTIGGIDYLSAYNFDELPKIMRSVLKKTAINSIFGRFKIKQGRRGEGEVKDLPNIISRKEIFEVVKKFKKFGTPRLNLETTQKNLDHAYKMMALASEHDIKGYTCSITYSSKIMSSEEIEDEYNCDSSFMEDESFREEEYFVVGGSKFLVDPNLLLINHRQDFHELRDRYRIYHPEKENGVVEIVVDATGGIVRINAKGAFKAHKDLKTFIPLEYVTDYKSETVEIKNNVGAYNKRGQWEWNFDYGRPIKWADEAITFGGLFPEATNDNIYDIMYHVRLSRSLRPFSNLFTSVP